MFAASFATCALGLLAISGSICEFVEVKANAGKLLYIPDAPERPTETGTFLGVICVNPLYEDVLNGDLMFTLSRACLFVGIAMGSFTCVLSWALSSFISPTEANWKLLSVFAAISAVLQMPVFLIFETDPCTAYTSTQRCGIATGSFYLVLSTIFWIVVTVATQFLDPPRWADELNAWRTKRSVGNRSCTRVERESQAPLLLAPKNTGMVSGFQNWINQRRWAASMQLPNNQTDSLSMGEEEELQRTKIVQYFASRTNSRLELNVANGKRRDDGSKSVRSFEDLESTIRMAEAGRQPGSLSLAPPSKKNKFSPDETGPNMHDSKNRQIVVWDSTRDEEAELVEQIYNALEDTKPGIETQPILSSASPVCPYAAKAQQPEENTNPQPTTEKAVFTKSSIVIKSLAENMMKVSRARQSQKHRYALMEDNDSDSSHPMFPTEVIIHSSGGSFPDISENPTELAYFPCYDEKEWNGLPQTSSSSSEARQYPDPIISMGSFESSTEKDKLDPIIFSTLSIERDACSADGAEAGDWDSDSDTSSECSGSAENLNPVFPHQTGSSSRNRGRGFSSVRSVVSCASLLDTIIAEETAADLEYEEAAPYELVRSKSAPMQSLDLASGEQHHPEHSHLHFDHASTSTLGSNQFQQSNTAPENEVDNVQLAPITSVRRSLSLDSGHCKGSTYPSLTSSDSPHATFDTEVEGPVDAISFSSSEHNTQPHQIQPDDALLQEATIYDCHNYEKKEDDAPCKMANCSQSTLDSPEVALKKGGSRIAGKTDIDPFTSKRQSPSSPVLTAPETPCPAKSVQQTNQQDKSDSIESERSWKEERQLRGGIHAPLDDLDNSSIKGGVSRWVRQARVQRLKREAINRGCAQSRDSTPCRRPSPSVSSCVDRLDLQLIKVLRPEGVEYGPDERSL